MKKATISILCVLFACSSFAQLSITPQVGYNSSTFYTTASTEQVITSSLSGFQAGALITKSWMNTKTWLDYLFLQTGLEFAQKGSFQGRGTQSVFGANSNIKLSYLEAPLSLGVKVKVDKDWSVFVSGGLYLAYGVSGSDVGTSQNLSGPGTINRSVTFTNDPPPSDDTHTYIKRFDAGSNYSAGIMFKNIEVKTVYGRSYKTISPIGTTVYKNDVWDFSIGYSFKIK